MNNPIKPYNVAVIQMNSSRNLNENLEAAKNLIEEAKRQGACLAVLPENFAVFNAGMMLDAGHVEASDEPIIRRFLSQQAEHHKLFLVAGTLPVVAAEVPNTTGTGTG
ncbi:MAG: hypothetical protein JKX83_09355, partial [Pseudomonadales bacterium]|nr:hypothetical protein [Pseudomonadales bacterium]